MRSACQIRVKIRGLFALAGVRGWSSSARVNENPMPCRFSPERGAEPIQLCVLVGLSR